MKQLYSRTLRCALPAALAFCCATANAEPLTWQIQGKTYNVDTLFHAQIGPGTTQTSLELSGPRAMRLFYTVSDITNPYVDMRGTKGGNKVAGAGKVSAQGAAASREGAQYFAGVNADFFGGSIPCGAVVVDGLTIYGVNNNWDCWWMTDEKRPGLGRIIFAGNANCGEASHRVTGINSDRGENALVIYNSCKGSTTGTNTYGIERRMELIEGSIGYTGKAKCRITSENTSTALSLSGDQLVLSGHGSGKAFLESLNVGDEVEFDFTSEIPGGGNITQMIGGMPVILSNGEIQETMGAIDHLSALHPRTAIGYNEEATKVVLMVVDGRTTISQGCTSKELGDIMRNVGCSEALNFDGGGSSELYTTSLGVRNSPSDGTERTVVNAVWAVSTAPTDNEVTSIAFENHTTFSMPRYGYFNPRIYGYNKYGVLVDTDFQGYTLSCPEELGSIVDNGLQLFANGNGCHALTATLGEQSISLPVEISDCEPAFQKTNILLNDIRKYPVEVAAEVNGKLMAINNGSLSWTTSDIAVADVDENGIISGVGNGKATVNGVVENFSGNIEVEVQIPDNRYMLPEGFAEAEGWTLSKAGMNSAQLAASEAGVKVDYNIKAARTATLTIKKNLTLYSLPDSVRVTIDAADSKISSATLTLSPAVGRSKTVTVNNPETNDDGTMTLEYFVGDFFDSTDISIYPIAATTLKLTPADDVSTNHSLVVRSIEGVHNHIVPGSGVESAVSENAVPMLFPNPVKAGGKTMIEGVQAGEPYIVYTITGMEVCKGYAPELDASTLAPGFYFVHTEKATLRLIVK
ncbi:MAG: phosphodiester glycosidase family protein [Muribaculaceae bacterium]|nr:phosphodiester glycosidase family protein [Muribaculaceae bacterium]